jgi:xylan 1,4-beta-xylosidase
MLGNPDSCGVWAPALRHVNGLFHLIYTDLKRYGRTSGAGGAPGASLRDIYNYLVTAPSVTDDWSDPVFLNSSGFDPSFFADDDGRQYVLNQLWDHRPGHNRFNGIVLQEYSPAERRLVGERKRIFEGTHLGLTEAPHIHKRDGWYYLLTAEGGTGWGHAASLARSRDLLGPYELHPDGPLLTSRDRPDAVLQRAGHADWVDTPEGETFLVHLCGRPLRNRGRCTLGRETAIQRLVWADGWPRLAHGDAAPALTLAAPNLPAHEAPAEPVRTEFGGPTLPIAFQWLRSPFPDELFSLTERPGFLRLFGRESMGSSFRQALVARRQQAHCFSARTCMEYEPAHYQQSAGLVCYYGANKFHYLYVTQDEEHGRHLRAMSALPDAVAADSFTAPIALPPGPVHMRVEVDEERLRFAYSLDAAAWAWLPELLDASILSDEAAAPGTPNFTGAFVGMCCQDTAGTRLPADFAWFEYHERPYQADPVS